MLDMYLQRLGQIPKNILYFVKNTDREITDIKM